MSLDGPSEIGLKFSSERFNSNVSFSDLVRVSAELCSTPIALLCLFEEENHLVAGYGILPEKCPETIPSGSILLSSENAVIHDEHNPISLDDPWRASYPQAQSMIAVPILSSVGRIVGSLICIDRRSRNFELRQIEALESVARQISLELKRLSKAATIQNLTSPVMEERYKLIVESAELGILDWNIEENSLYINPIFENILDFDIGELSHEIDTLWNLIYDQDLQKVTQTIENFFEAPEGNIEIEFRAKRKYGGVYWLKMKGRVTSWALNGKPKRLVAMIQNVTTLKLSDQAFSESQERFAAAIQSMQEGLIVQNGQGQIEVVNSSACRILGMSQEEMGQGLIDSGKWQAVQEDGSPIEVDLLPGFVALNSGLPQRDVVFGVQKPNCDTIWISVNSDPIFWPGEVHPRLVVSTFSNVTESRNLRFQIQEQMALVSDVNVELELQRTELSIANSKLQNLATSDGLTGLKNHRFFQDRIRNEFENWKSTEIEFSVILLDVDKFKTYNDSYGHPAGDQVLIKVSQQISSSVRESDIVARYGGEEFAVILPNQNSKKAKIVAEKIRKSIEDFEWELRPVTASIGVASVWSNCVSTAELIAAADKALYESKHKGRNRVTVSQIPNNSKKVA